MGHACSARDVASFAGNLLPPKQARRRLGVQASAEMASISSPAFSDDSAFARSDWLTIPTSVCPSITLHTMAHYNVRHPLQPLVLAADGERVDPWQA